MKRCLFVDDSSVIRKVAKRILTSPGLEVVEAASGHAGIDHCAMAMPDYILVDAGLPDMPVEEFIRHVRAFVSPTWPLIGVALVEVDVPVIMRAKRAGAQGYFLKPFNRAQLLESFRGLDAARPKPSLVALSA